MVGYLAAVFTTFSFVPQVIKVMKDKQTRSISLPMYIIFSVGVLLWLIYGLILNSLPIIIANLLTLILAIIILVYKLKYK
ncbi:MAG TPA: SemiSWEET transporter [Candidatus Kapabacteria bacterium]|nr:SemiSWEET transporter [Candidatus Kapabacteria bacterium]